MASQLNRLGVSVTISLIFSTDFVDEAEAKASVREIVDSALREVENEVDNDYVPGVYSRTVKALKMEAFPLASEYAITESPDTP